MCTFELSGCRVKPRHNTTQNPALGAAGASHDSPRTPNVHISGPGASNTTKIQREDTHRDKKRTKTGAGGKKKGKFALPPPLHPSWPCPLGAPSFGSLRVFVLLLFFVILLSNKRRPKRLETPISAKVGLAKVGHPNFWPKSVK